MGTLLGAKKSKNKTQLKENSENTNIRGIVQLFMLNSSPVSKDLQRMLEINWKKQSMLALVKANHKELHIEKKWL